MVLDLILPILVDLITDPIKQYIVTPVTRRIGYVFNCSSKVQTLQDGVEQLKNKKDRLQQSVDDATRNGEEIYPNVTTWLSSTDRAIGDAEQLLQHKDEAKTKCMVGLCPNFKSRYQLSKKAVNKTSVIDTLRNEEGLDSISFRAPLQQIVEPSLYSREALPSRVSMLNQIIDALRDPNLNMIGIHGMGGVGKTTLTKEVQGKAVAEKLFDAVIFVAVSQTPELRRIQAEIGDFLGLKFVVEELSGRASQLYKRLEKSKVLIILDDLWQKLDFNAVGIPFGDLSKSCKIMLTSRSMDLLSSEMRAQKLFSLEALKDDETWSLFEMSVVEAKDPKFHAIATEIAKKCAGLPLLIQLVATELQNKESYVWEDKLNQLSALGDEEIYERVYKVLESSYDNLPGEEIKSFFLLCAVFGQSNIQIQYLLTHSMGLGLFKHIRNVEGARAKVLTLIDKLKAKSLLLDGDMIGFIKMHDVVRDTALAIASRVQHAFIGSGEVRLSDWPTKDCMRIYFLYSDVRELPVGLDCPEAELFLLLTEELCLEIPDAFFEQMNKLKVVDFTGMRLVALPSSIGLLKNLQTLCLHRCRLDNVAMVGELKQLKSLSFANSKIGELPREIDALTQLKLLDLRNCYDLKVIPENVFSKLGSLEELYMLNSFVRWNAKGQARLVELDNLSHLSTLEIQIVNSKLIPQNSMFFHGLRSYKISIGDEWGYWGGNDERSRTLKLKLDAGVHLEDGIQLMLKGSEELYLFEGKGIESILYDLDQEGFPHLKHLHVQYDFDIQHLIKSTRWASCVAFPILESLDLHLIMNLEKICDAQLEMGSFGDLQSVKIRGCHKLKSLFSFASIKCLPHLREMEVESCENMEAVVDDESGDEHNNNEVIEFIQLSSLKLDYLPNLTGFCKRKVGTAPMELLFNEMVSFPNLTSLEVSNCKSLKYVFAASMVECLLQLKKLDICDCELVEELIQSKKDEEIEEASIKAIGFPNLDFLRLQVLPNVKMFSCGFSIEFPLLRELKIVKCSAMKNFVSKLSSNESDEEYLFNGMVTFSNLEKLELEDMNFKYLWAAPLTRADDDSFSKLKSLSINKCSKLSVVFPSHAYTRFQRLEALDVSYCGGVEEIYQYQGINFKETNNVEAFLLRNLQIKDLPSLKNIWSKDPCGAFTFENLQSINVWICEDLKYVFPASIACGLLQLQELKISFCGNVEAIIAKGKDDRSDLSFLFPELTVLELVYLKEMRSLYEGPHTFECPKLKTLEVRGVSNIFIDKYSGNVKELRIDEQGFNWLQQSGEFSGYKLKKLTLERLNEESFLFGFLQRLKCLEMLVFESCDLEEIFFGLDNQKPIGEAQLHPLISLKHLELNSVRGLKHIITRKTDSTLIHILQHLHTLNVHKCYHLMNIAASSSSASFQNLTTLCVEECKMMRNLVTASTAKTMVQLVELKVAKCDMMEEIVTKNDGDDTEHDHVITFKKLKRLELNDLPKFKCFCSNSYTFSFPLLEQVTVNGCPGMKTFSGGDLSSPKLRQILFEYQQQWEGNLNATIACQIRVWVGEHVEEGRLFQNVESLQVVNDAFCSKAMLANQMQFLNKLRKVTVRDCESVQVVFDLDGLSVEDEHSWLLPQLYELNLVNLPRLTQLCNKAPKGILDFSKLEVLEIEKCCGLEYIFTCSMASCLFRLGRIEVKNCEMLKTIIKEEEGEDAASQAIHIGSLESILVECLPKFSSIYSGSGDLECPLLKYITIRKCPSMKSFISRVMREDKEEHNLIHFSHKFIPNLEELELDDQSLTDMHRRGDFSYEFFSRLKKVTLRSFKEEPIPSLFGALRRLWSSERLDVSRCSFHEISVLDDEREIKEEEHRHLRLKQLNLSYVENLKHMMKKDSLILNCILQNLQTLKVEDCHDLINITPSSASFRNLTILEVENCEKMTSLVTASTAKTMVQLMELKVSNCTLMEEIVAFDADCTEHDVIIFDKLKSLKLTNLYRLNSFCSADYAFSFPFLEEVNYKRCYGMKFFCGGDVSTPKLRGMRYEDEQQWEGNLNATISFQLKKWVGGHFEEGRLFPNVESLEVVNDAFCSKAILANQMHLNKLRKITVRNCESVQVVFELEGLSAEDEHVRPLPQLDELHLVNLALLTQICNEAPRDILDFNNLKVLKIEKCSRLEYVFTWSMASSLFHLQRLHLKNCEMMKSIIKDEEADKNALPLTLGSLESIDLKCLPNFSSIYSGSGDLECPSLKKISIRECPTIKSFVSKLMRGDRQGMEELNLICFSHKVFPELEELSVDIKFITAILQIKFPTNLFSKVKNLKLGCCSATTKSHVPLVHFLSRLPNVVQLRVSKSSLKELFKFEGLGSNMEEAATQLPKIRALNLENLDSLKHIWGKNSQLLASIFQNLTSLFVYGCNQLSNLITSSVAKSMVQLETLTVESCKMLMEVVGDRNDIATEEIVFTKMKTLALVDFQSLGSFSLGCCTFEFPCLEQVVVSQCPNMRVFCPGNISTPMLNCVEDSEWLADSYWEGNLNSTIEHLYKTKVGFKRIEDVKISIFRTLRENWGGQFPFEYFDRLERLVVDDCPIISYAVSSHLLEHLEKLEVLIVEKCDLVEQVFDLEGLNATDCGTKPMKYLSEMHLIDLPKLTCVWSKDPQQILSFKNLQLLKVHNCANLNYVFNFSVSLNLPNLQLLEVKNCNLVEHIIAKGEENMQEYQTVFPSLQSMNLHHLTSLLSFYSASAFLECPSLKMIEVAECPNMELLSSAFSNQQDSCMIAEETDKLISNEMLFLGYKVAIPGLEELKAEWNSLKGILYSDSQPEFLNRLKHIELTGFQGDEYGILPSNFLQRFPKLEKLAFSDASFEEVNLQQLSILKVEDAGSLVLSTKLKLSNLPKLKHLVHDNFQLVPLFPILEDLEVVECSRLKILVPSTVSFQNLTSLEVSKCDGLINLMTASTARSLVQLRRMNVKDCKMMQEIVAIASDGVKYEIRFSQLEYLGLDGLPCLTSFCSGNCGFHFPSLKEVMVTGCPKIKMFSEQVPTTPKLWRVKTGIQEYDWEWEGSLNNTVQALFLFKDVEETST